MLKYAVAIIFYNPDERAYRNICEYQKVFNKILIVDNSDMDNSEKIRDMTGIIYKPFQANKGMSFALDTAYRWAIDSDLDYLLTMDQDTWYPENEIRKMLDFINSREKQIIDDVCIFSANYTKQYFKNDTSVSGNLNVSRKEIVAVDFSMTSGSYMRVDCLKSILPLDNWFIGMVDYDVCASIKKRYPNTKIIRYGDSVMYQVVGEQLKDNFYNKFFHVVHLSDIRYYYMERNSNYFLRKYRHYRKYVLIMLKQKARIYFNLVFERNRIKKIRCILAGYKAYRNNELGIERTN